MSEEREVLFVVERSSSSSGVDVRISQAFVDLDESERDLVIKNLINALSSYTFLDVVKKFE